MRVWALNPKPVLEHWKLGMMCETSGRWHQMSSRLEWGFRVRVLKVMV